MGEPSTTAGRNLTKRRKLLFMAAGGLATLAMAVLLLCVFLGIRSGQDLIAYYGMVSQDFHPVWKDLAWRRVHKGDGLAETIEKHPPLSREDFGPYTVLVYDKSGPSSTLQITAVDGVLIDARTLNCPWRHVFFESPDQRQAFLQAWSLHRDRIRLEDDAWRIHQAILAGQDVFFAERIERRELPQSEEDKEEYDLLVQAYGAEFIKAMLGNFELTVEVSKVLHGDLKPGTTLTFSGKECDQYDLAETPTVFLHVEDSRTIDPDSEGGELYTTVPAKALEWYQSLTPDQIQEFGARYQSELAPVESGN